MRAKNTMLWSAVLVLAGCGTATEPVPTDPPPSPDDVAAYDMLLGKVEMDVETYRFVMSVDDMSDDLCHQIHDQYEQRQRTWMGDMLELSGRLDEVMFDHAEMGRGDNTCIVNMMLNELDDHHAHACLSGNWADNKNEAMHHVEAMEAAAGYAAQRCEELMNGFTSGDWHFGPMMDSCRAWTEECGDGPSMGMMHCQD
jgi:hypothetical protein